MRVIGKHRLVAFELLPRNVTGMMVVNQDHPCITRLEMPLAFSGASIDDLGSGFRFAEGIGARVHRIPEHVPDGVVHREFRRRHAPAYPEPSRADSYSRPETTAALVGRYPVPPSWRKPDALPLAHDGRD